MVPHTLSLGSRTIPTRLVRYNTLTVTKTTADWLMLYRDKRDLLPYYANLQHRR